MFLSRNNKNNIHPYKPHFYYMKVGFKGAKLYKHVFVMISFHPMIYPPGEGDCLKEMPSLIYLFILLFIFFLKNKKNIFKCCPFYFIVE